MAPLNFVDNEPADTLYLWWTADPDRPVLIGELGKVRALRGVSLRYAAAWRATGFPLSKDLPLIDTEFFRWTKRQPPAPSTTPGPTAGANASSVYWTSRHACH